MHTYSHIHTDIHTFKHWWRWLPAHQEQFGVQYLAQAYSCNKGDQLRHFLSYLNICTTFWDDSFSNKTSMCYLYLPCSPSQFEGKVPTRKKLLIITQHKAQLSLSFCCCCFFVRSRQIKFWPDHGAEWKMLPMKAAQGHLESQASWLPRYEYIFKYTSKYQLLSTGSPEWTKKWFDLVALQVFPNLIGPNGICY